MIRADLFEEVEKLNREGFRVLGIAYREFDRSRNVFTVEDESQLVLLGYIAFMDPPKESALEAIRLLGNAGLFDQPGTKSCRYQQISVATPANARAVVICA